MPEKENRGMHVECGMVVSLKDKERGPIGVKWGSIMVSKRQNKANACGSPLPISSSYSPRTL